jgi:hypothetical protein
LSINELALYSEWPRESIQHKAWDEGGSPHPLCHQPHLFFEIGSLNCLPTLPLLQVHKMLQQELG